VTTTTHVDARLRLKNFRVVTRASGFKRGEANPLESDSMNVTLDFRNCYKNGNSVKCDLRRALDNLECDKAG
jgi:hypothetical protein